MRRAFTLVELIVVLACLSAFFCVALMLFFSLAEFQVNFERSGEQTLSTDRFLERFREDAHASGAPEIPEWEGPLGAVGSEETPLISWERGEIRTAYLLREGKFPEQIEVVRREFEGEVLRNTYTYHLLDDTLVWCERGIGEFENVLALNLWRKISTVPDPEPGQLDPFTREVSGSLREHVNPKFAGNWRTVLVRTDRSDAGSE